MELNELNIPVIITLITAIAALYKYVKYNEGDDKLELNIELNLIDAGLLELKAKIENKGKVRAKILMKNLTWKVNLHNNADSLNFNSINKNESIGPFQFLNSSNANDYTWINGSTTQYYVAYVQIDQKAMYIDANVRIKYLDNEKEWQSSRKVIKNEVLVIDKNIIDQKTGS